MTERQPESTSAGSALRSGDRAIHSLSLIHILIELKLPERRDSRRIVRMASLCAGLAACLCIAFFGWYQPNYAAYGTMRMSINPDVELTLSRTERVLDAEGLNADGVAPVSYTHLDVYKRQL